MTNLISATEVKGVKIEILQTDDVFTVKEFVINNPSEYVSCNILDLKNAILYANERTMYILGLIEVGGNVL